jgi:hypothetical protein
LLQSCGLSSLSSFSCARLRELILLSSFFQNS